MERSPITTLFERVTVSSFTKINDCLEELLTMKEDEALSHIYDEIARSLYAVLDTYQDTSVQMVLQCCLERSSLFTKQPESLECITENESPGRITAHHCVYHNLYDALHTMVEDEVITWYLEHKEELSA